MKMNLLLTVAVSVLALGSSSALAAEATGEGTVTAKIVAPVSITQDQGLDFGTMISPSSATTVTIAASNGARTSTNDSILVGTSEGAAGRFEITGADGQSVDVTLPSQVTLSNSSDGEMTVNNFSVYNGNNGETTFNLTGTSATMNVGATLNVGADQAQGTYTGSYTVTVSY